MLESNKDPYKNAVRLYKMHHRANKFSNRVLDTPKLDGKPQDCEQPHSVSRPMSVDNAALSTLQSRLARLEHHLCREQSSASAGTSREAPVASLIDLCTPDQPQVPLRFDERRILSGATYSLLWAWPTLVRCRLMQKWLRTRGINLSLRTALPLILPQGTFKV